MLEKRIRELVQTLELALDERKLDRAATLKLRGRLGFADGFLHGRLGSLILERLLEPAYGTMSYIDEPLANVLALMTKRLETAGPKKVDSGTVQEWCIFSDASFEPENSSAGLGAVLVDSRGGCAPFP